MYMDEWMKCIIGLALKKFSNIQKLLGTTAVDDTNVMFFPFNFPTDEANFPRHP